MNIQKNTAIEANELSEAELEQINAFASAKLEAEDVFTFKAVLCDSHVDRDQEAFSPETLAELAKLFLGKPVIKDHHASADNQIARIYHTEVIRNGETAQLTAHCYMVRTAGNVDLIKEIQGGIKKEGSVGCAIGSRKCSICGTELSRSQCRHIPGKSYDGKTCYRVLSDALDAYEFSLVAVPAQKHAGISKQFEGFEAEQVRIRARIAGIRSRFYKED